MTRSLFDQHSKILEELSLKVKNQRGFVSLHQKLPSNTTRTKSYKKESARLDVSTLNRVLAVDCDAQVVHTQPLVNMQTLVKETLIHGLFPAVVPEFKGITVGGAIMGAAGESGSHKYGLFGDQCVEMEVLCGDGEVVQLNDGELFHALQGSYGSFGALTSTKIKLIQAKKSVHLRYHHLPPEKVIEKMKNLECDFIDGLIFSKEKGVVIEGNLSDNLPTTHLKQDWYFPRASKIAEEYLPLEEYLFRYDQGAFWMGAYLMKPAILSRFLLEGVLKWKKGSDIRHHHALIPPHAMWRGLFSKLLNSQSLWKFQHQAEEWVQDRFMIQDFCIPEKNAEEFLLDALENPGVYPIWICPVKGTKAPQYFSPHFGATMFYNIGLYGIPATIGTLEEITKFLEGKTKKMGGRKVLYSRSYYSEEEFWEIYPREKYDALRKKTKAEGVWRNITEKVLSI